MRYNNQPTLADWYVHPDDPARLQFWDGVAWKERYRPNPTHYRTYKVKNFKAKTLFLTILISILWLFLATVVTHLTLTSEKCFLTVFIHVSLKEQRILALVLISLILLGYVSKHMLVKREFPNGR